MSTTRLVILGAGSVRCSVPVIAALAVYFGERPLEVVLYDSDAERLDLFDRFARLSFTAAKSTHDLFATDDAAEALDNADKLIIQVGENCARKYLKQQRSQGFAALDRNALIEQALDLMLATVPPETEAISLIDQSIRLPIRAQKISDWPATLDEGDRRAVPFQVLRWIKGEEYLHELFREATKTPVKTWLDGPVESRGWEP